MSNSFGSIVEEAFGFLNLKHGFRPVEKERATVVYESLAIFVSLFYDDQRSFEISLGLGRKNDSNHSYTFDDILRSQSVPLALWPSGYSAKTLNDAQILIEKISKIIASYAVPLLQGDAASWARIAEQRRSECEAYAAAAYLVNAKRAANSAWAAKDYPKVVEALTTVETSLSKADLSKLAYAKQAIAKEK
jgi:hypothetical protein